MRGLLREALYLLVMADTSWQVPHPLNLAEVPRGYGGTVAPLLAGFSLAVIATLVSTSTPPPLAGYAVLCFAVAASALLFQIQYSTQALMYAVEPAQWMAWFPAARLDYQILQRTLQKQANSQRSFQAFYGVSGLLYQLGLIAFLAGLVCLLVPRVPNGIPVRGETLAVASALLVAAVTLALELLWVWGNLRERPISWLHRVNWQQPAEVEQVTEAFVASVAADRQAAMQMMREAAAPSALRWLAAEVKAFDAAGGAVIVVLEDADGRIECRIAGKLVDDSDIPSLRQGQKLSVAFSQPDGGDEVGEVVGIDSVDGSGGVA